ncbi:integral membrane protein MviN [Streptomyces sp. NBRC 110611]|uniref:class E sortase n=1 Tax=Streptomyces sp. NBRC 110611 TaxID=1621259 RepID=UPI0008331845|nr:class E sortase [Streptomyces sp. NBRC 110611]GAU66701.1 integral membrane protein MviN [Streptomyces sp. NBRC 110611]
MTALRPERGGRPYDPYEPGRQYGSQDPYGRPDPHGRPDAFEAAVEQLDDPLNDPLPGQATPTADRPARQPAHRRPDRPSPRPLDRPVAGPSARPMTSPLDEPGRGRRRGKPADEGLSHGSPWFRPRQEPERPAPPRQVPSGPRPVSPPAVSPVPPPSVSSSAPVESKPALSAPSAPSVPSPWPDDDETMALRQAEKRRAGDVSRETRAADVAVSRGTSAADATVSRETATSVPALATGGRAARRKAAQEAAKRNGRRARHNGAAGTSASAAAASPSASAPMSRVEARRAARAAKDSPSLIVSRALGEVFITLGVLMLLFVTYQLWWTNVRAEQEAGGAANTLQHEWDKGGGEKKNLAAGERFGIMYIPKLDVKAPIAEGIAKKSVLDHGMIGHYDKVSGLKTAMPWDKKGNFAVAGHRNTHGEPFRYINRLTKGDKIIVETQSTYYTYEMESILPQTSPGNVSVLDPVPRGSGFTGPGRYLTLTTCTPEFTSTFRMIVWGKMVDERPRSKGKPEALGG